MSQNPAQAIFGIAVLAAIIVGFLVYTITRSKKQKKKSRKRL